MGTNFYMSTKLKEWAERAAGNNFELTDRPDWGYEIHLAKTSGGWLPLFQTHVGIQSVQDIKKFYDTKAFIFYDEYAQEYTWEEFEKRVLNWNGGIAGAIPKTPVDRDSDSVYVDNDMPTWVPVSHFDYGNGKYADRYRKDKEGYEFTEEYFR